MLSKWLKRIGLAGLLVLGGARAHASAGIDAISYSTMPSLTSAHVNVIISGDTDSNAVVRLFYTTPLRYQQLGASAFTVDTGMVAVRRLKRSTIANGAGTAGWMLHGQLLHLGPNTKYYYKVERTDAISGTVLVGSADIESVTTLAIPTRPKTGPRIYVRKDGSDSYNGLSPTFVSGTTGPKLTINAALTALSAQSSNGANGGIEVGPGIYYERIRLNIGSDAAGVYRYLTGQAGQRDSTIIDGSFEPAVDGYVLNDDTGLGGIGDPVALAFTNTGQDSTYKAYFPSGDSIGSVVVGWGEYIHRKTSILEILNDAMGELSGWFWQNDTLYVKRKGGTTPGAQTLHVGYGGIADGTGTTGAPLLAVQKRNWHISNLTFRFNGVATPANGHGLSLGTTVGVSGAGTVIDSCRFYGNSGRAVYGPVWSGGAKADSVWVLRSIFDGLTVGRMTYQAGKNRLEESTGSITVQGTRPIIWKNTIQNLANGVSIGTGSTTPGDTAIGYCGTVSLNTFRYISDDPLELEGAYLINVLVKDNDIRYTLTGISCAPAFSGPLFIVYNTISQYGFQANGRGLKLGATNGYGRLCVWQNTFTTSGTSTATHGVEYVSGGASDLAGLELLNNAISTSAASNGYTYNLGALTDTSTNSANFNRVWSSSGGNNHLRIVSTNRSFAQAQLAPVWDKNGANNTSYADSAHSRYTPIVAGGGRRITGVNTNHMGPLYSGTAPSIGSSMFGWPRPRAAASRTTRPHLYKEL